jgi:hypothetical protein
VSDGTATIFRIPCWWDSRIQRNNAILMQYIYMLHPVEGKRSVSKLDAQSWNWIAQCRNSKMVVTLSSGETFGFGEKAYSGILQLQLQLQFGHIALYILLHIWYYFCLRDIGCWEINWDQVEKKNVEMLLRCGSAVNFIQINTNNMLIW